MQPIRQLERWLAEHANPERYLLRPSDIRSLMPDLSDTAFKAVLSRAAKQGILERVCRGLYIYPSVAHSGLILFHAASALRSNAFNYISLETALSDVGVISQIPMSWISILSSERSNTISCGRFGTIEFVHTCQRPEDLKNQLNYDEDCRLWRASVPLALRDMRATHRNCDLIDWEIAREFI